MLCDYGWYGTLTVRSALYNPLQIYDLIEFLCQLMRKGRLSNSPSSQW